MKAAILVVILLSVTFLLPGAQAATVTQTRYLTDWEFTLGLFGYTSLHNLTANDIFMFYEKNVSTAYAGNFQLGFQAYRDIYDADLNPLVDYEELTSGKTVLYEESKNFGEGWLSTTWDSPAVNLSRLDFLQLSLYVRFRLSAVTWSSWYVLISLPYDTTYIFTEPLCMDKLLSSAWNFTFYLWAQRIGSANSVRIYLGNSTYNSRIENMQFDNGIEPSHFYYGFMLGGLLCGLVAVAAILIIEKKS